MFKLLYNLAVSIALFSLRPLSWFNSKVKYFLEARSTPSSVEKGAKKFWFHCASLGEYEMALPLIQDLVHEYGKEQILITFFSPSGYTQASKNKELADAMMYIPLDSARNMRAFFQSYRIEKAVIVRYDLWYNMLRIGSELGVKFYLINARINKEHFIFKTFGKAYRDLLSGFEAIFCSDEDTFDVLTIAGMLNIEKSGDTRVDRVLEIKQRGKEYSEIAQFKGGWALVVLGSSWNGEEELLSEIISEMRDFKWIIAPHDVSTQHVAQIEELFANTTTCKYSQGVDTKAGLLILDQIGHLSSVYRYADVAVVGGGFKGALHNIYEPMVWGAGVLFGPRYEKFPEAKRFIDNGIAHTFRTATELKQHIQKAVTQRAKYKRSCESYLERNKGSARKILDQLKS